MNKLIIITIIFVVLAVLFFISLEKFPTYLLEPAQVKTLVSAANNGDKDAMWDLYFHFEESGKKEQALYWLHKGASSGDSRALYWIYSLQKDSSIQTERNEAFESLKLAAEGGDSFAALQLGKQYIDGRIVNHDVESGKKWLKFAVSDGNIEAMLVLGNTMVLNCTELDKAYGLALLANDMSGESKTYQLEAHKIIDNVCSCAKINPNDINRVKQKGLAEFHELKKMLARQQGRNTSKHP